jgi:hypothetical protein
MRQRAILLVALVAAARTASAEPDTCAALPPVVQWSALSTFAQHRFPGGAEWEAPRDWTKVIVTLDIDRAPHIAHAILEACPGVHVTSATALDVRRLTSNVSLTVTSYTALSRLAQLPAIRSMYAMVPFRGNIKHPMPIRDPIRRR